MQERKERGMSELLIGTGLIMTLVFGSMLDSANLKLPVIGLLAAGALMIAGIIAQHVKDKFKAAVDAEVNRRIRERRYEDEV